MDLTFTWGAEDGGRRERGADAFKQDGRGLVVGILGNEFTFEGFLEDGLAKAGGAAKAGGDRVIQIVDKGQLILKRCDQSLLLCDRRQGNWQRPQFSHVDRREVRSLLPFREEIL